jgi:hypothetical protein
MKMDLINCSSFSTIASFVLTFDEWEVILYQSNSKTVHSVQWCDSTNCIFILIPLLLITTSIYCSMEKSPWFAENSIIRADWKNLIRKTIQLGISKAFLITVFPNLRWSCSDNGQGNNQGSMSTQHSIMNFVLILQSHHSKSF